MSQSIELFQKFISENTTNGKYSQHAIDAFRSDLRLFLRWAGDKAPRILLSEQVIRDYVAYLLGERQLKPASVRRHVASISSFAKYAADTVDIVNPFRDWKPAIRRPKRLPRAVSRPDVARLLVRGDTEGSSLEARVSRAVLFLGATGLRVSEMCKLSVCDVTADGSQLHVAGKGSKDRIVYIGNADLQQWLAGQRVLALNAGGAQAALFRNSRGNRLQPQTLRNWLRQLCEARGLDQRVTPHMLRHSAATWLIEDGVDIRIVQRLLGHSSIATTEIYTRVSDTTLRDALRRADVIAGLG